MKFALQSQKDIIAFRADDVRHGRDRSCCADDVNPIPDGFAGECDQLQSIRRLTGTRIVLKRELLINQKGVAGCQYFAHSAKNSRLEQKILVLQGERLQLQDLVAVE
jgi:hypothetical protein